jgi:hypothetical protein
MPKKTASKDDRGIRTGSEYLDRMIRQDRSRLETARFVPIGKGRGALMPFRVGWEDDPNMPYDLELVIDLDEDGRPECIELRCIRKEGGPPITGQGLRELPISSLVRRLTALNAYKYTVATSPKKRGRVRTLKPGSAADAKHVYTELGRRWITREHLEEVARLYEEALELGNPAPTRSVAESMHAARSTAAKWVMRCRDEGLLPPTDRKRRRRR